MKNAAVRNAVPVYLGIECGATRTVALVVDGNDRCLDRREFGPANVRLLTDAELLRHFRLIQQQLAAPAPTRLAIGMAGARTAADRARIGQAAATVWRNVPCHPTNDLETGLMAADLRGPGGRSGAVRPRVLIISGTGSCCFGRDPNGRTVKVGGWGHILGDQGSGYAIGLQALQAVVHQLDCTGQWPPLGRRLLRALQLNSPEDLVGWAQSAAKPDIAALAVEVFAAAASREPIARRIVQAAADRLAADAVACARRVARPRLPVQFILAGSIPLKQPPFAARLRRQLRDLWPDAEVSPLRRESVWGAIELARQGHGPEPAPGGVPVGTEPAELAVRRALAQSPTEQRNPRSMELDRLPVAEAIALMLSEDARIPGALLAQRKAIEAAIGHVVRAFRRGGRLLYVGAGTSGRLGVLDASECPPTFSVPPDQVQGIIAGGQPALWQSLEGAEDDPGAGAEAIVSRGVSWRDVVVGIAASGRTPFVWGALREARRRAATTVLLCFNPNLVISRRERPTVVIAPDVGPEVLTGSTRLKAGTATKLVLNLLTTLAMVRLGKVRSNLMVDVKASNAKLRDRAIRILQALTGLDEAAARRRLERAGWNISRAAAQP